MKSHKLCISTNEKNVKIVTKPQLNECIVVAYNKAR